MASRSKDQTVSVVMPVHNALPFLDDAVRSILDQTHRNFEFVIYDDASTDGSTERLREWAAQDERVRLIEGEKNLGPVGSSMMAVDKSTGAFVARMDADDLSHPQRLELELRVLEANPAAGLVGTMFDIIDDDGRQIRTEDHWRLERKSAFLPLRARLDHVPPRDLQPDRRVSRRMHILGGSGLGPADGRRRGRLGNPALALPLSAVETAEALGLPE